MAETGTILAQGLPCMSTNMAKRNSTPSRSVAAFSSATSDRSVSGLPSSEVIATRSLILPARCCRRSVVFVPPLSTMLPHGKQPMVSGLLRNVACRLTGSAESGTITRR